MRKITSNADVMTTREVGERLGVALRTVQLWVESGQLPAWRTTGGHRRIARAAVEALAAQRSLALQAGRLGAVPKLAGQRSLLLVQSPAAQRELSTEVIKTWSLPLAVRTADGMVEGLLRLGELHPDVLVLDVPMPSLEMFELIRTIKAAGSHYARLQMVVAVALTSREIDRYGNIAAGVKLVPKPLNYGTLEKLLKTILL